MAGGPDTQQPLTTSPATAPATRRAAGERASFYVWVAVILAVAVVAVILGWHSPGGTPDPTRSRGAHAQPHLPSVIDSAILVFREGLQTILVLAATTASFLGSNRAYRRPVAFGSGI